MCDGGCHSFILTVTIGVQADVKHLAQGYSIIGNYAKIFASDIYALVGVTDDSCVVKTFMGIKSTVSETDYYSI